MIGLFEFPGIVLFISANWRFDDVDAFAPLARILTGVLRLGGRIVPLPLLCVQEADVVFFPLLNNGVEPNVTAVCCFGVLGTTAASSVATAARQPFNSRRDRVERGACLSKMTKWHIFNNALAGSKASSGHTDGLGSNRIFAWHASTKTSVARTGEQYNSV